jgi:hypothetical protein
VALFRTIESPVARLRHHFEQLAEHGDKPRQQLRQLGEQGHKTGEDIARGMSAAALSMRALGVAGLAVYSTYETLSKTFKAVAGVAGGVFSTGINTGAAGANITEFAAISQALKIHNVPEEETQNWLAGYSELQKGAIAGAPEGTAYIRDLNQRLARASNILGTNLGIDPYRDTWEEYEAKLSKALKAAPDEATAYAAGREMNLSRLMVQGLREVTPEEVEIERHRAPTPGMLSESKEYTKAMNNLANAWNAVLRSAMLGGLASALTKFANALAVFIGPGGFFSDVKPGDPTYWLDEHGNVNMRPRPGESPEHTLGTNNPGNIKGLGGGYQNFGSPQEGVDAIGEWLQRSQSMHGTTTLRQIIERYAPSSDPGNAGKSLPEVAARRLGISPDATVDMSDPIMRAKVVDAIMMQEQGVTAAQYLARSGATPSSTSGGGNAAALATIRQSGAQGGAVNNYHDYGDVNVGDINVSAPTREGQAIGGAVSDRIQQLTPLAYPANTGTQ